MGCHPMLTENAYFVTNALRGDVSTVNVRPDAATALAVCSSGLEIEFYPNLTPE